MSKKPSLHNRKSIRLKNYDYSQPGFYFITICTWKHIHLFGEIENDQMSINKSGEIAEKEWFKAEEIRSNIKIHEFTIMPNHLHGIIEITGRTSKGTVPRAPTKDHPIQMIERFGKPTSNTLPTIIRSYKAYVTRQVRILKNNSDFKIWQRNYFEHIIRNEESYLKIAEYIKNNPLKWKEDKYYG
jgi:REP element-mobilizing transposase RayT